MNSKIALSTALSANHNWDPVFSLELTQKFGLDFCQIYIGEIFNNNSKLLEKIRAFKNIKYIIHSPSPLNTEALKKSEIDVIENLIPDKEKYVVYHHDYKTDLHIVLDIIENLNNKGITPLLENFYSEKRIDQVRLNINSYIDIITASKKKNLKLFPLIDFPRLFIHEIAEQMNSEAETNKLLDKIAELGFNLYIHAIDVQNPNQNRESWCEMGRGCIPYNKIFQKIIDLRIQVPLIVLEYEEEKHIPGSLQFLL